MRWQGWKHAARQFTRKTSRRNGARASRPFTHEILEQRELLAADILYRVNAGGPAIADPEFNWAADTSAAPSSLTNAAQAESATYAISSPIATNHPSIPAGTPASLFQSERYDATGGAGMAWNFPVTPGQYQVNLYFADIYFGTQYAGARKFDVAIEGAVVLDDYDVFADVGGYTGVVKSFTVASDDVLNVNFAHVVENPAIKGIEIRKLDAAAPANLGASLSTLTFASSVGQPQQQTLTLTHLGAAGSAPIVISGTTISGGAAAQFSDSFSDAAPLTLQPGQSTSLQVTYNATTSGTHSASLAITHSGANSPLTIALNGSASTQNQPPVLAPIGNQIVQGTSLVVDLSASDTENDPLQISVSTLPSYATFTDDGGGHATLIVAPPVGFSGVFTVTATVTETTTGRTDSETFTVTIPSQTSQSVLMVVANPAQLAAGDQALVARLQGLGYAVTLADDNLVTASSTATHNLIVLAESVASDAVGNKLTSVAKPIIVMEPFLYDNLGMTGTASSNYGWNYSQSQTVIQQPTHYLAAGLSGPVTIYSGSDEMGYGLPNANAISVAASASNAAQKAVFAYDAGAAMPGLAAPARRLAFFADVSGLSKLNANGWKLFDAAVRWSANQKPAAAADSYTTAQGAALTVAAAQGLLANDSDQQPLTVVPVAGVKSGVLSLAANGGFTYTPNVGFSGTDSFTYQAFDGVDYSPITTVTLQVQASGNSAPQLAAIANQTVVVGQTLEVALSATDAAGQLIQFSTSGLPTFGTLVNQSNGVAKLVFNPTTGQTGAYTITVTATDNGSPPLASAKTFTLTVNPAPTGSNIIHRINAGGDAVTGTPAWSADSAGQPSPYSNVATAGSLTYTTGQTIDLSHASLPSGTPMAILQSERYDDTAATPMQWDLPVTPGQYEVRLYFSENWMQGVGQRIFDVSIEGQLKLDDYDIFADVGGFKGVMKSFVVTSDSNLDIDFVSVLENPQVKAIEVIAYNAANQLLGSTSSVDFGTVLLNSTNTRTVTLTNAGGAGAPAITINPAAASLAASAAGVSFAFAQSSTITLAPGQSTTVTITFAPTTGGARSTSLVIPHSGTNSPLSIAISGLATNDIPISFGKSLLGSTNLGNPTSLQFGPDGRLYVAQQNGHIFAYTIARNAANSYVVTAEEKIDLVQKIINHNDDGAVNSSVAGRLVTGILVTGTAANPILYVTSSDPRIGAGPSGSDLNLDTNSGILSRLTWNGSAWSKLDLVRGLPRSEENHASNGMALDKATNTLYIAQGGNTNMGAPSVNFANLPEYALSAAILSVNLNTIGNSTYDLPTLDDESRSGVNDANDPFGGNDGKNQAKLVPGGPVQVYSPGYRNPYDVLITKNGRMFTVDNGPNGGWGDVPIGEGPAGNATNQTNEPGVTHGDGLHYIPAAGYYGGHPNPTRSNPNNKFNTSNPQSPVSQPNAIESDYLAPGPEDGSLVVYNSSSNGIAEYTASNFGGKMTGDLLVANFANTISRVKVNSTNTGVDLSSVLFNSVGQIPLDVVAQGDNDPFPGTIWVADTATSKIIVFEPGDFSGSGGPSDPNDLDGDGYTNADETANGTDPQSAADIPHDWDADFVSDLLDPNDDNDGLPDTTDPLAIDASNGQNTSVPVFYTWENDAPSAGGILGLGFTGLMTNGSTDYRNLYDPNAVTAGGAAGVLTIDAAGPGTALGSANSQQQAYQFGVNIAGQTQKLAAQTRIVNPFAGLTPQAGQEMGFYIGDGGQNNYIEVALTGADGGGVFVRSEFGGVSNTQTAAPLALPGAQWVDLYLSLDPVARTVQASYAVTGANHVTGPRTALGAPIALPAGLLTNTLVTGVIAVSPASIATPLPVTWDFLGVVPDLHGVLAATPANLTFISTSVGSASQAQVQVTNLGQGAAAAITISAASFSGAAAAQFSSSFTSPVTLLPGESTTLTVTFTPTSSGTKSATLNLTHNGVGGTLAIPLSGSATGGGGTTAQALVAIDTGSSLDSSTYNDNSFIITNQSTQGQKIASVTIDLASSLLPDVVFDPNGTAGDVVAKGFVANSGAAAAGFTNSVLGVPYQNGYRTLTANFTDFQPGETFKFSIDVDPTTIRGLPNGTSNPAGSVSGLELTGATVTVQFDTGGVVRQTYRKANSSGASQVIVASSQPAAPTIQVLGLTAPATTSQAAQTVRITGTAGAGVSLLVLEAGQFLQNVPGGGFDVDPYEGNSAVRVEEKFATIGASGFVDVPLTLVQTGAVGGYYYLTAAAIDALGRTSLLAPPLALRYVPAAPASLAASDLLLGSTSAPAAASAAKPLAAEVEESERSLNPSPLNMLPGPQLQAAAVEAWTDESDDGPASELRQAEDEADFLDQWDAALAEI